MIWRWDQGRSNYFHFSSIQKIAPVLLEFNGADMAITDAVFREQLLVRTGLPFAPGRYTVKRNYKRVFECSMLATYIGNRLVISDIGRAIASGDSRLLTADGYLSEVERRFRFPYPAFNNYSDVKNVCFPFIAIQKLLFARVIRDNDPNAFVTLNEVGCFIIANNTSGLEDIDYYMGLTPKPFTFRTYSTNDQERQVREMMAFISQHSYLSLRRDRLSLHEVGVSDCKGMFDRMIPFSTEITTHNPTDDFLRLTVITSRMGPALMSQDEDADSIENFAVHEGKKVFKQHLITERNPKLRIAFIHANPEPVCDACGRNMHELYPWTGNILEIHHLLPLSSYEKEEDHLTSLNDLVGLCPSCHRAIHLFYRTYLASYEQDDFSSAEEAQEAYHAAKMEVESNV